MLDLKKLRKVIKFYLIILETDSKEATIYKVEDHSKSDKIKISESINKQSNILENDQFSQKGSYS